MEFYDVRDAAKALEEMNGKEIHGKVVVIEFSRPGGHSRKFMNAMANNTSAISTGISAITVNSLYPRIHKYPAVPPTPPSLPRKLSGHSAFNVVPPRSYTSQTQFSANKKSYFGKAICNGSVNVSKTSASSNSFPVEEYKMASLNLGGGAVCNGVEEKDSNFKRLTRKSQATTVISKQQQQQQQPRIKPRKGRQAKKFDSRFLINEDAIRESNCRDSRTTVMIKNIPNKYRLVWSSALLAFLTTLAEKNTILRLFFLFLYFKSLFIFILMNILKYKS